MSISIRKISRAVWVLSLVSMFADIASEMLYPVIPVYLQSIGFSVLLIGILEGVAEATSGLSKGYFGKLSDERGKRMPFIRWGYFLSTLAKPMMVILKFPFWVFLSRATDRLGKGLRTAPRDALLSAEATPATKAAIFSFHRGWDTLGAVFGPAVALIFLFYYPQKTELLFFIAFVPGLIAVFITYLIKEAPSPPKQTDSTGFFEFLGYWKEATPEYRRVLAFMILFALFNSSDMLLILRVKQSSGSEMQAILVYIFYNIIYAVASYPMGIVADKIGIKNIFLIGLLFFVLAYFGMSLPQPLVGYYALFGIYGLYMAATEGISKAWLSNLAPAQQTGTAIGLFVSLQSIALMIASAFAGLLWVKMGASATFVATAIISIIVFFLIAVFTRKPITINQNTT